MSVAGVISLAGCATMQTSTDGADARPDAKSELLASVNEANGGSGRAPRVRLYVPGSSFSASRYIDAQITVNEDAYVMVVAVDRDRRVHVVFPESPEETGFVSHESGAVHAKRFFAGFGSHLSYASYYGGSNAGIPGNMVAIASDRPLQFQRLTDADGDWDEYALERLVFTSGATGTSYSLGKLLTLTGQSFSSDRSNFNGGMYGSSYVSGFNACSEGSGYGFDSYYNPNGYYLGGGVADNANLPPGSAVGVTYSTYNGIVYAQYRYVDRCGRPYYSALVPVGRAPARTDTTTTKKDSASTTKAMPRIVDGGGAAPGIPIRALEDAAGTEKKVTGYRIPRTGTGAGVRDGDPQSAGGIRFRSPEEVRKDPGSTIRSRGDGDTFGGRARNGHDYQAAREAGQQAARGESNRAAQTRESGQTRAEPVRSAPAPTPAAVQSSPTKGTSSAPAAAAPPKS